MFLRFNFDRKNVNFSIISESDFIVRFMLIYNWIYIVCEICIGTVTVVLCSLCGSWRTINKTTVVYLCLCYPAIHSGMNDKHVRAAGC